MKHDKSVAYPVMEAEIVKRELRKADIAKCSGIKYSSFSRKLNGKAEFSGTEMLTIWTKFFHDVDILELFNFKTEE